MYSDVRLYYKNLTKAAPFILPAGEFLNQLQPVESNDLWIEEDERRGTDQLFRGDSHATTALLSCSDASSPPLVVDQGTQKVAITGNIP